MLLMRHPDAGEAEVLDEANFVEAGWADRGWELVDDEPEPEPEWVEVTADDVAATSEFVPSDDPTAENPDPPTDPDVPDTGQED